MAEKTTSSALRCTTKVLGYVLSDGASSLTICGLHTDARCRSRMLSPNMILSGVHGDQSCCFTLGDRITLVPFGQYPAKVLPPFCKAKHALFAGQRRINHTREDLELPQISASHYLVQRNRSVLGLKPAKAARLTNRASIEETGMWGKGTMAKHCVGEGGWRGSS